MKHSLLSLLTFLLTNVLWGQDTIIMRNGEEVRAKVQEISATEIKYKKFDNQNGPLYSVFKTEVFVIKYENGNKDVFSSSEDSPVNLQHNAKAREDRRREDRRREDRGPRRASHPQSSSVKKIVGGAIMTGMGVPLLLGGTGLLTLGISIYDGDGVFFDGPSIGLMAGGSLLIAGGIVLEILGPITISRGIKERRNGLSMNFTPIYNPTLDRYATSVSKNKLGVTFTF